MKTSSLTLCPSSETNTLEIIDFYNEATEDYQFWSSDFNMHFGYFKWFQTNPFKRDSMLNTMNAQVVQRLQISTNKNRLIDLGCGMGATMRYALKQHPSVIAYGVTLSDFQYQHGNALLRGQNGIILKENYHKTSFQSNAFDSAVAIESFCHSGHNKQSLLEAYRLLKPNGRLVIADGFLKKDRHKLRFSSKHAYNQLCNHWSLTQLANIQDYKRLLESIGFKSVTIENISWRVAPSVLHVPFAIIGFILKKLWHKAPLKRESLHNLKGSFYALLSGLHLHSFGYYIITAKK